ncbi:flagellin [Limnohabitans sp. WS1]|uniref:flagellin N-terminal helical domain-containing protein n=1 Tax=Limnohabitans sp. WS1 TaxID=1100726 RepID=UPI000D38835F|nr:flagellin [Limnohabitans sp. WS1]PUE05917.1 hypothetical protein B9Z48_21250 [Limnohabitans sp. WS1]
MTVINTNVKSLISQNALIRNNRAVETSMEQLSTGKRINSSADDATGMAITNRMTSQIRGLDQAVRNANDGISLIQTVEGSLNEVNSMLQRMRELSIQSANDTNTVEDRGFLDMEFQELKQEINRVAKNTQWNGMDVLNKSATAGNGAGKFEFQVGANANQLISIQLQDFRTDAAVTSQNILKTTPAKTAADLKTAQPQVSTLTLSGAYKANDTIKLDMGFGSTTYTVKADDVVANDIVGNLQRIRDAIVSKAGIDNALGVALTSGTNTNEIKFTGPNGLSFTPQMTASFSTAGSFATVKDGTGFTGGNVDITNSKQSVAFTFSGQYQAGDFITLKNGSSEFKYEITVADAVNANGPTPSYTAMANSIVEAVNNGSKLGSATAASNTGVITFTAVFDGPNTLDLSAKASTSSIADAGRASVSNEQGGNTARQENNTLTLSGKFQEGDVITLKNGTTAFEYEVSASDATANLTTFTDSLVKAASGKLGSTSVAALTPGVLKFTALTFGENTLDLSATVKNANLFATEEAELEAPAVSAAAQVDELAISGRFDSGDKVKLTLDGKVFEYTLSDADVNSGNPTEAAAKGLARELGQAATPLAVNVERTGSSIKFTGKVEGTPFTSNVTVERVNPQPTDVKTDGGLNMIAQSNLTTSANAQAAIANLDKAMVVISESRANMGAVMNRLTFAADNLINVAQNSTESRSRILDTDFAKASSELARTQIISQAATSVLAQANQSTQSVMKLLQG